MTTKHDEGFAAGIEAAAQECDETAERRDGSPAYRDTYRYAEKRIRALKPAPRSAEHTAEPSAQGERKWVYASDVLVRAQHDETTRTWEGRLYDLPERFTPYHYSIATAPSTRIEAEPVELYRRIELFLDELSIAYTSKPTNLGGIWSARTAILALVADRTPDARSTMTAQPAVQPLEDDELMTALQEAIGPAQMRQFIRVVWKDGIDINEPSGPLRRLADAIVKRVSLNAPVTQPDARSTMATDEAVACSIAEPASILMYNALHYTRTTLAVVNATPHARSFDSQRAERLVVAALAAADAEGLAASPDAPVAQADARSTSDAEALQAAWGRWTYSNLGRAWTANDYQAFEAGFLADRTKESTTTRSTDSSAEAAGMERAASIVDQFKTGDYTYEANIVAGHIATRLRIEAAKLTTAPHTADETRVDGGAT